MSLPRTQYGYVSPRIQDNAIPATAFKAMAAPRKPGEREENETEKGLRVQDKGFLNTAVIRSEITYIDGEAGVLRYRGYPIEQLALHSSHLETAYLLIYGSLPTKDQFKFFESEVMRHSVMHSDAEGFFRSFRSASQRLYTKGDKASLETMDRQIYRLIGKATTLAAMAYRVRQGRNFVTPPTGLSYTGSFLYQMDHIGEEDYVPNPVLEKALDVLFLIHADHELNASCTTVLQTGSSLVDPYSAIAGPLHGGANEAVIRMLISIGSPENVPAFLEAVKKKEKTLSGFGHRTGKDALLETAMALHDAAMKDEYFIKRKLAPNVDFCGLIYRAMGFPLDFFPVLFAVPRVVGWLAHWRQMMLQEGGVKIWRPRQVYVGPSKRDYVPVDERVPVEGAKQTPSRVEHGGITKRTMLATFKGKSKLVRVRVWARWAGTRDERGGGRCGDVDVDDGGLPLAVGRAVASACRIYVDRAESGQWTAEEGGGFWGEWPEQAPAGEDVLMVVLITLPCYEAEAHAGEAARICFSFTDRRLRLLPLLSPSPHPPRGLLARILRLLITLLSSLLRSLPTRRHTPTMYPTLVSVALFSALAIQGALADFTVVTPPEFVQCEPIQLTWDNTNAKSYNVIIVPSDDPCNEVIQDYGDHTTPHITITPTFKEGSQVMISVLDSNDQEGWSGSITVKKGNDTSCLPAASSASSAAASSTASAVADALTGSATGTTLVVNPAAAPTSASAVPSGSSGAQAVGAANEGILGNSNGALASVKLSASAIVLTALGAVAAIAF
ncbi:hypothetical protein ACG7TL_007067 [Trametes sanguinea]